MVAMGYLHTFSFKGNKKVPKKKVLQVLTIEGQRSGIFGYFIYLFP